ncbi:hypothetical protein C8F01DRAFT_1245764 [Mycena amicta]|nr:hypothetical protein C8F01DRAFT_1245764 [Mycena amicta]
MGKSAKLHKRSKKTSSSTASTIAASNGPQAQAQAAKKKAGLKQKAAPKTSTAGHVLGGADYVDLMMGSRKRARAEAAKLPREL